MARSYWIDHPSAWAEGYPLDASLCAESLIQCTNATYEVSGYDQCIVLPAAETAGSGWYFGPIPILARLDRTAGWRDIGVRPLCAGGGGQSTLRVFLTPERVAPSTTHDVYVDWTVAGGDLLWQSEATLSLRRDARLDLREFTDEADGDYRSRSRLLFLVCEWASVANSPSFGGLRFREVIST